eukprot:s361_g17.t1
MFRRADCLLPGFRALSGTGGCICHCLKCTQRYDSWGNICLAGKSPRWCFVLPDLSRHVVRKEFTSERAFGCTDKLRQVSELFF